MNYLCQICVNWMKLNLQCKWTHVSIELRLLGVFIEKGEPTRLDWDWDWEIRLIINKNFFFFFFAYGLTDPRKGHRRQVPPPPTKKIVLLKFMCTHPITITSPPTISFKWWGRGSWAILRPMFFSYRLKKIYIYQILRPNYGSLKMCDFLLLGDFRDLLPLLYALPHQMSSSVRNKSFRGNKNWNWKLRHSML